MEKQASRPGLCLMLLLSLPQLCLDQEVPGSRPHQARNVWLWESAFCFAAPSEPQAPAETTQI